MTRSAHREAAGYFAQALSALPHLAERCDTREQAIDLRLALRSALLPLGEFARILVYLREAEALATALDDPRRLGQVSLFLSNHVRNMGMYAQAIAAGQRALALATAGGDVGLHAQAHYFLGRAYHAQGAYREAIGCFGQTVVALDGAQLHERFGGYGLPAVLARVFLAWCHAELGTFAEGRAIAEEGLRIAEAGAHLIDLMTASWGRGLLALRSGDLSRARPLLERAVSICQTADLPANLPRMAAALGAVHTLEGRLVDAVALLTQAMTQTTAPEMLGYQALCRLALGEAQMLAGDLEEAHTLAESALALAQTHQERGHQAYALRLLGEIAARRELPESAQAGDYYRQAIILAEALGMRPLQAHCHRDLGTLYATIGRYAEARAELDTAIEMYRAMDMTFWLPQAEATLVQVEGE